MKSLLGILAFPREFQFLWLQGITRHPLFKNTPPLSFCGLGLALLTNVLACSPLLSAQQFQFPTHNHALFDPGGEPQFFVGTPGKSWQSGAFGCVRSEGHKFHEGLDIRSIQRNRSSEAMDPVMASADGTVAYINAKPQWSNYGNYIVIRHFMESLEVYSLYAHLATIRSGLKIGDSVRAGESIGILGRTTNTHDPITKDRAHCHFEINLVLNERFAQWHNQNDPQTRNDHGNFNGHNLAGLDPRKVLLEQKSHGTNFSLLRFIQSQPELCRVVVRETHFPFLRRYRGLVQSNPVATREGIAGYELSLTFNGLPIRLIPRSARELASPLHISVASVNLAELQKNPCGNLILKRGQVWTLLPPGQKLLSLLLFDPAR